MKKLILSREEIYERENRAYNEFCIPPLILMENAGRETALEVRKIIKRERGKRVLVFAGPGNNGGDGLVSARYLYCSGVPVSVVILFNPDSMKEPAFTNFQILVKMKVPFLQSNYKTLKREMENADIFIDAIFGIGLTREIKGTMKDIICQINEASRYVVSVDVPSGIDVNTGEVLGEAVKADETICFGFGKKGLYTGKGKKYAGNIKIVDICFPPELYC